MTLCNMALMAIGDIFSLHPGSWYSNKISLSQEPKSGPIPDDRSHHAACEAQFHDILRGVLIGVFPHHLRCKFDVAHLSSKLIYETTADISLLLYI